MAATAINTPDFPVEFGGVSIGQKTARIGLTVSRDVLNINAADELFVERRVTGIVVLGGGEDSAGQTTFIDTDERIEGTFDIHRFGVKSETYTTGLTFNLKDIDIATLALFSKGKGRLILTDISEIPTDVVDEHDDDEGQQSFEDLSVAGEAFDTSLDFLFTGSLLKNMKAAGLQTVRDIVEWTKPDKSGFCKQLTDIKGVGESAASKIELRMIEFWRDNPQEEGGE